MPDQALQTLFLRLGLAAGFLSAAADRLGFWGSYGRPNVAWGDMEHFLLYTAKLNPWFPRAVVPAVGWAATIAEIALAVLLLIGLKTRWTARLSGLLLLAFALGMTVGTGVKTAFDASVFAASGGAFMLATARRYAWSLDEAMKGAERDRTA
ncbi:MAG: DoxX protein [Acidobacteriota bacterium]|nr:DoxX protein [Acidobacteriota bacterium]